MGTSTALKWLLLLGISLLLLTGPACKSRRAASEPQDPRCVLQPDPGPCRAAIPRYYYDADSGSCQQFMYGGCQGTVPFETLEACEICLKN